MSFGPAVFTIRPYKVKYERDHISKSMNAIQLCFEYDIGETKRYLFYDYTKGVWYLIKELLAI